MPFVPSTSLAWTTQLLRVQRARDFTPMAYNELIFFGTGERDDWATWVTTPADDYTMVCCCPRDAYYYEMLLWVAETRDCHEALFRDLMSIFMHVGKSIEPGMIARIRAMSLAYGTEWAEAYNGMLHVYYGMVAEENAAGTKLGAEIKINGLYSLLIDRRGVQAAASECRGMSWQDIHAEAGKRHLYRNPAMGGWSD